MDIEEFDEAVSSIIRREMSYWLASNPAEQLNEKLDKLLELAPTIEALGSLLVRRKTATDRLGLNRNTLDQNDNIDKYEEVGRRKTFIEVGDIAVVKKRKRSKTHG
jgi:hypothetical protein